MSSTHRADQSLLNLLRELSARGYCFTTVTPATHARVLAREPQRTGTSLTDIFGWSLHFAREALDAGLFELLERADALADAGPGRWRARCRVSTFDGLYLIHSAYPTEAGNAVFFGPDSARFAALIQRHLAGLPAGARIADYGTGTGIGGLVAARGAPAGALVYLCDVNPDALRLAATNAAHAGVDHDLLSLQQPGEMPDGLDLIVTHPPFMMDSASRTYRDGGDMLGARLSFDWAIAAAGKLTPGGRLIMHTGSSIAGGQDLLKDALTAAVAEEGLTLDYWELETDYYGEELETPAYRDAGVERIAMVAAIIDKRAA